MLQIIRGKLVIFLITLCLFVVYLGFDNNSNYDIVFYGHKTPKSVEIYLSEKNIIYKIYYTFIISFTSQDDTARTRICVP